ncbi:hypothetical protein AAKU55_003266 [Oxalobacteraceae bacterium GrIS 1.11]
MQRHDDSPPKTSRPSLLSAAQQAEADRSRILTNLEGTVAAGKPARARGSRKILWSGVGMVALAMMVGAGVWLNDDGDQDPVETPRAHRAPSTATTGAPITDAHVADAHAAATIHDEVVTEPRQTLREMLTGGPKPAPKTGGDILSKALEGAPQEAGAKPESSAHVAARAAQPAARDKVAHPKASQAVLETDSDVTLLAALVAHAQANFGGKKAVGTAAQLLECKKMSGAEAELCRARACAKHAKTDTECLAYDKAPASP